MATVTEWGLRMPFNWNYGHSFYIEMRARGNINFIKLLPQANGPFYVTSLSLSS